MRIIRFEVTEGAYYGSIDSDRVTCWSDAPWRGGEMSSQSYPIDEVRLLSPCEPPKVIGVAINYPGATGLTEEVREPLVFMKPGSSVIGPNQEIVSPFEDVQVWGECELGIVIGKRLQHADKIEAADSIYGFTVGNDVSADNVQGWDHHLARSKAADTFCVLGPWIDTDYKPSNQGIYGYHNGELLRQGRLNERLWREPDLLVWLSSWMTLEPGDVILTGAPTRVRDRQFFQDGDRYACKIEGLAELTNPFRSLHGKRA